MTGQPRGDRPARTGWASLGSAAACIALCSLTVPPAGAAGRDAAKAGSASDLLHVPVVGLQLGDVDQRPTITNPVADDPGAAERGMQDFVDMNCVGCHAANGAGGMGPALSNAKFIYGSEPANIYLTILQGRPNGMPAWGGMLPAEVIWDLVAYILSISKEPEGAWGKTTSAGGFTVEQVPAEFQSTATPWQYTKPFSYGQAPDAKPKDVPPPPGEQADTPAPEQPSK